MRKTVALAVTRALKVGSAAAEPVCHGITTLLTVAVVAKHARQDSARISRVAARLGPSHAVLRVATRRRVFVRVANAYVNRALRPAAMVVVLAARVVAEFVCLAHPITVAEIISVPTPRYVARTARAVLQKDVVLAAPVAI
jgi:hypothetical protein